MGVDLVVGGGEIALDQEPLVLRVEDRRLVVVARESLDGLQRVPEREHHELGPVVDIAAKHPDAVVAGTLRIAGHTGLLHVPGVRVAVLLADGALPDASDHRSSSTLHLAARRWAP